MTVSVAMAVYHGEKYLARQIDSILPQLQETDELVISLEQGDHSCDEILQRYTADPRVKTVRTEAHGVVENFENALRHCTGELILLCDQDDVWQANKVLRVKAQFEKDPKTMLVLHDATVVDGEEKVLHPSFFAWHGVHHGVFRNWWKNCYMGCCMAFRRILLESALPFPQKLPMHDQWLGMLAERAGAAAFLEEPLLLWRRHGANTSQTKHAPLRKMLGFRLTLAIAYSRRKKELRRLEKKKNRKG